VDFERPTREPARVSLFSYGWLLLRSHWVYGGADAIRSECFTYARARTRPYARVRTRAGVRVRAREADAGMRVRVRAREAVA
jgi:hypothetical protein